MEVVGLVAAGAVPLAGGVAAVGAVVAADVEVVGGCVMADGAAVIVAVAVVAVVAGDSVVPTGVAGEGVMADGAAAVAGVVVVAATAGPVVVGVADETAMAVDVASAAIDTMLNTVAATGKAGARADACWAVVAMASSWLFMVSSATPSATAAIAPMAKQAQTNRWDGRRFATKRVSSPTLTPQGIAPSHRLAGMSGRFQVGTVSTAYA